MTETVRSRMDRLRRQVEIHSIIYYKFDTNIVSDKQFDDWCQELVALQSANPEAAKEGYKADKFADFTGDTGMQFMYEIEHYSLAQWLIARHEND